MVVNIITKLKDLGFSEYEGKAYVALLGSNPATAYEVARNANLPTSKIYGVIAKLERKGMVQTITDEGKKRYIPLNPDEFIDSHKTRIESTLSSLKKDLTNIKQETDISYIWNIKNYDYLMEKAERLIEEAEGEILISTWKKELSFLVPKLRQAEKRKIKIAIVHFGIPEQDLGQIFQHPIEETLYEEKGGRGFTIIADSKEAVMGTVLENGTIEGAWSQNSGFVTLAEDYIKHDIYIMKIVKRFNKMLIKHFGEGYKNLRDIFSDNEVYDEQ